MKQAKQQVSKRFGVPLEIALHQPCMHCFPPDDVVVAVAVADTATATASPVVAVAVSILFLTISQSNPFFPTAPFTVGPPANHPADGWMDTDLLPTRPDKASQLSQLTSNWRRF
jgi:hypothetical protein